jgi:hypothetical protein
MARKLTTKQLNSLMGSVLLAHFTDEEVETFIANGITVQSAYMAKQAHLSRDLAQKKSFSLTTRFGWADPGDLIKFALAANNGNAFPVHRQGLPDADGVLAGISQAVTSWFTSGIARLTNWLNIGTMPVTGIVMDTVNLETRPVTGGAITTDMNDIIAIVPTFVPDRCSTSFFKLMSHNDGGAVTEDCI